MWTAKRGPENLRLEREKDPIAFADKLLFAGGQERIVGFKMLNDQARPVQEYILSRSDIKKIVVCRSNVLSVYASNRIARATGQWIVQDCAPIRRAMVTFDPDDFAKFVSVHIAFYARMDRSIRASGSPHIRLEYEDLANSDIHETILDFLGADPTDKLSTRMIKQNPGSIEERFTNWDRVVATLSGTEMEGWLQGN